MVEVPNASIQNGYRLRQDSFMEICNLHLRRTLPPITNNGSNDKHDSVYAEISPSNNHKAAEEDGY